MKINNSKETNKEQPIVQYDGKITVIENTSQIYNITDELLTCKILGFDTETKPSFVRGVKNKIALLQICSEKGAFLFRLNKMILHPALIRVLENESILKVGVAIRDDLKGLRKLQPFTPRGFIDLQSLAPEYGITALSLKGMAEEVLHQRISKRQQTSNWETLFLTKSQIVYAATDAWIAMCIYKKLTSKISTPNNFL